jgi:DNA-binding transcriptional MerR regulator
LRIEGFTAAELGAKVGISARTVRYYSAERVLPAVTFRGTATRYTREHLVRLAAVRYLQKNSRLSLQGIRSRLDSVAEAEVERLAVTFLPELAPKLPVTPAHTAPLPLPIHDAWHRMQVLPGLEIHLHASAGPEARTLAQTLLASATQGSTYLQTPAFQLPPTT